MKIGVMGLGNICQKAYLPIMNNMRTDIDWHFYSRQEDKLKALQQQFGWENVTTDFDQFLASGIEAIFIHTPTATHGELIKQFLTKGIHVFVDKPVSEDFDEVQELHDLAAEKNLVLMTGFNRRYAPLNNELKKVADKRLIIAQKNRMQPKTDVKFEVFDMMIHMVDTTLYLLDEPIEEASYEVVATEDGRLRRAMILFKTENTTAVTSTNMEAGAHTETVEIQGLTGTYTVSNLSELVKNERGTVQIEGFGDWENTLAKRGFKQAIELFIDVLNNQDERVAALGEDSLLTHYYVNKLYQSYLEK